MAIHPTAIVARGAEIDPSAEVGPYCVIDGQVRVGANTRLFHGVYLTGWTQIDENCVVHPGAVVGHEPQDVKYHGERSYCRIGAGTILREHVTVHRGTTPDSTTEVGEECFLLAGCHVAHNCVLARGVTLINNVLLAGHVTIGDRATLGGGAAVHQFVRIGELAMVPGNGRVPKDVPPFALLDVEGRIAGLNRVGMRRANLTREEFADVRDAYRVLFLRGQSSSQALDTLDLSVRTAAGQRLLAFIRGCSQRGIAGRSRRAKGRDEAPEPSEE